jgi:dTDP-4-amino-4,6-dideoxygalactose transaminase
VHGWQSYVCRVDPALAPAPRNVLMQRLLEMGVSTRPGTHCVTELGVYRQRFGTGGRFPRAAVLQDSTLAIPLHNAMDDGDLEHVAASLHAL